MLETGMVRRIDELGRVVIPKEIRKTLNIKDGNPLEIYTENDKLVLRKFSPTRKDNNIVKSVVNCLADCIEGVIILTDLESIVCVSGKKYSYLTDKKLSSNMDSIISDRESLNLSTNTGKDTVSIVDEELDIKNQLLVPIISNGDMLGTLIAINFEKEKMFKDDDYKCLNLGASFISEFFE